LDNSVAHHAIEFGHHRRYTTDIRGAYRRRFLCDPAIHGQIRQAVGIPVLFAKHVLDLEVVKLVDHLHRPGMELLQRGIADFVLAVDLLHHQLGIADHLQRFEIVPEGVVEGSQQARILGVIVRLAAEEFAEFGDGAANFVLDDNAISRRTGIAASPSIDVGHEVAFLRTIDCATVELLRAVLRFCGKWAGGHDCSLSQNFWMR
jgi:hypothetical protein